MNMNTNAKALTNEELEQTTGGVTVYTDNGFYVAPDPVSAPIIPVSQPVPVSPAQPTV